MNRDPLLSCLRGLDIHWWYSVTLETGEIEILMVLTNPFLNIHLHLQSFFASLRYIFSCRVCIYVLFIMCIYIYMYCTYIYIYHKYVHHELQRFFDLLCTYVLMAIIGRCGHGPTLPQLGKSSLGVFRCQERSLWCLTMASQCMVRLPCPQKWCGFELVRYDLGRFLIPYGKLT